MRVSEWRSALFVLMLAGAGMVAVWGLANREKPMITGVAAREAPDGSLVEVAGRVRRVGSEPFSEIVITDDYGADWYIVDDAAEVGRHEQQRIVLHGELRRRQLLLADGRDLGLRLELYETRILRAQE